MEIVDRLKSMVGIGQATIALSEVTSPLRPGEELRACVTLRGGDYTVRVAAVRLRVDEEGIAFTAHVPHDFSPLQQHAGLSIPVDRDLGKDEVMTLPVAIALPDELQPSDPQRRYVLVVDAEIPGLNPRDAAVIEVVA
jgi:hypothetical protein